MKNTDPRFIDLTGKTFGHLRVLEYVGSKYGLPNHAKLWRVLCLLCGKEFVAMSGNFKKRPDSACFECSYEIRGYKRRIHGGTLNDRATRTYKAWSGAKSRCLTETNSAYPCYGGRGIRICAHWQQSFLNFLEDMGECPDNNHSIERKDNNGHYSCGHCEECIANGWPANCKWATAKEQGRNKRNNIVLTLNGQTKLLCEWAEELGIERQTLWARKKKGWNDSRILTTPV